MGGRERRVIRSGERPDERPTDRRGWGDPFRAAVPQAVLYSVLGAALALVAAAATSSRPVALVGLGLAVVLAVGTAARLRRRRFAQANRWALIGFLLALAVLTVGLLTQAHPTRPEDCTTNATDPVCFEVPPR